MHQGSQDAGDCHSRYNACAQQRYMQYYSTDYGKQQARWWNSAVTQSPMAVSAGGLGSGTPPYQVAAPTSQPQQALLLKDVSSMTALLFHTLNTFNTTQLTQHNQHKTQHTPCTQLRPNASSQHMLRRNLQCSTSTTVQETVCMHGLGTGEHAT